MLTYAGVCLQVAAPLLVHARNSASSSATGLHVTRLLGHAESKTIGVVAHPGILSLLALLVQNFTGFTGTKHREQDCWSVCSPRYTQVTGLLVQKYKY